MYEIHMTWSTRTAALIKGIQRSYERKWTFLAAFLLIFFVNVSVLASLDVLPEPAEENTAAVITAETPTKKDTTVSSVIGVNPVRIEIPTIGLTAPIENPTSTSIAALDNALLTGAVRYPGSAKLGEQGNVVLMGHSSYLPVVHNQSFKAFNNIQKLSVGDEIVLYGNGRKYVYAVEEVGSADATVDAIPLDVQGSKLTLATCDSFGEKTDRFIVVATLVESYPVEN